MDELTIIAAYESGELTDDEFVSLETYISETSKATKAKRDKLYYGIDDDKIDDKPAAVGAFTDELHNAKADAVKCTVPFAQDVNRCNMLKKDKKALQKVGIREVMRDLNKKSEMYHNNSDIKGVEPPALKRLDNGDIQYSTKSPMHYARFGGSSEDTDKFNKTMKKRLNLRDEKILPNGKTRTGIGDYARNPHNGLNTYFHYSENKK